MPAYYLTLGATPEERSANNLARSKAAMDELEATWKRSEIEIKAYQGAAAELTHLRIELSGHLRARTRRNEL